MQGNSKDIDPFKTSGVLTPRMLKGYNFERLVNKELEDLGFKWSWTLGLGKGEGVDFYHKEYPIQIEAKFSHAVIYPCWIERDWISRFDNVKYKIVVTNRGIKLGERSRQLLKQHNIIHVFFDQLRAFVQWLIFLIRGRGVTSSRTTIYYSLLTYCTSTIGDGTYRDITYKNKRIKHRYKNDFLQSTLGSCADDHLPLLAYILGISNLSHTIKHTCLNDLGLTVRRIYSFMPLSRTLRTYTYQMGRIRIDTYNCLSRTYDNISLWNLEDMRRHYPGRFTVEDMDKGTYYLRIGKAIHNVHGNTNTKIKMGLEWIYSKLC
jgi:hypothetical protein